MVLILLLVCVGVILGGILSGGMIIFMGVGAFFGFMAGLVFAVVIGAFIPQEDVLEEEIWPLAFQTVTSKKGFFRTNGYDYLFYYQDGNKIKPLIIPINQAVIYEDDRGTGLVKVYYKNFAKDYHFIWGVPNVHKFYELYVPRGAIFVVDEIK